jgi:pimeloyl-ACP methyl ester carboxylesterase
MFNRCLRTVGIATLLLIAVFLLIGYLYHLISTKIDDYNYPPPGKMVDVGGFQLHINCTGKGKPTVVLEAGIASSSLDWALVQPEIAKFTSVCSYDRAGMGWSQESPNPRTSMYMIEELHTLLKNANIPGPYIFVGHSFGGINVRLYASRYPDEVFGLVLVDSSHELQHKKFPPRPKSTLLEKFTDSLENFFVPFGYGRIRASREQEFLQPFPEDIQKNMLQKSVPPSSSKPGIKKWQTLMKALKSLKTQIVF